MIRENIKIKETNPKTYEMFVLKDMGFEEKKALNDIKNDNSKRAGLIIMTPEFSSFRDLVVEINKEEGINIHRMSPAKGMRVSEGKELAFSNPVKYIARLIDESECSGGLDVEFKSSKKDYNSSRYDFYKDRDTLYFRKSDDKIVCCRAYIHSTNAGLYTVEMEPEYWHSVHAIRPSPASVATDRRNKIIEKSA